MRLACLCLMPEEGKNFEHDRSTSSLPPFLPHPPPSLPPSLPQSPPALALSLLLELHALLTHCACTDPSSFVSLLERTEHTIRYASLPPSLPPSLPLALSLFLLFSASSDFGP